MIAALVEETSVNATVRMTGVSKVTIPRLLAELGPKCADYQDRALRGLKCKRIKCDEIWNLVYAKDKTLPTRKQVTFGFGSVWTRTAIDAGTKLVS